MTIPEFADQFKSEHPDTENVYIALMPNEGQFDLEVEVNEGSIGGVYRTEDTDLETARQVANQLEVALRQRGIFVYPDRESWNWFLSEE